MTTWGAWPVARAVRHTLLAAVVVAVAISAPAVAAVRDVEISWPSGQIRLSGELLLPASRGPHPAVVMLHGSGSGTREDFRRQARFLARRGLAALIFDKRGSGRSGGDGYRYAQLTADARAAVRLLSRRRDIRKRAIALWGLSEGAFIVPRVAAANPDVAAIVTVGGAAISPARQQEWAVRNGLLERGAGAIATRPVTTFYRLVADTDPDFRSEPGYWWRKVAQPVLAVWGSDDQLVPIRESARALRAHLQAGPNSDRTFRTFAGAGHGLDVGFRGDQAIDAPGFLELTARWLRERLAPGPRRDAIDTPLPKANGVTVSRAVDLPAWHGTQAAQIAWPALVLAAALLALALRSGIPTKTLVALDVLGVLSLAGGLALITAENGQSLVALGYPLALWLAVALTIASVALTARLVAVHARNTTSTRQRTALTALSISSALLIALMTYWLL
ncbi:MAG: alpha/beta fold hydrolase [Chloroflexota bacterium]|nr:alpha/beta fold hydrolase [Chloroflexota bacterium]